MSKNIMKTINTKMDAALTPNDIYSTIIKLIVSFFIYT